MADPRLSALDGEIGALAADFSGRYGVAVVDFVRGERFSLGADERFPTASLIKLPIHSVYAAAVAAGDEDADACVQAMPADAIGGGVLADLDLPARLRLRDLAALMLTVSDNFATNLVIRRLGIGRINAWLAEQGLGDGIRLFRELVADSEPATPLAEATPAAVVQYLTGLRERRYAGADITLAKALRQQHRGQMGRHLPLDGPGAVALANKPGSDGGIRCDAGLVSGNGREYAFCMMTADSADRGFAQGHEGEILIGHACRLVYDRLG